MWSRLTALASSYSSAAVAGVSRQSNIDSLHSANVGAISRFFGLDAVFRKKVIQLLDLGYALRLKLPLIVSAGFVLCHLFISYVPRVEIIVQPVDGEGDGDGDDEDEAEWEDLDELEEAEEHRPAEQQPSRSA